MPNKKAKKVNLPNIAGPLLQWYDEHGRNLPWRAKGGPKKGHGNPYHVWLSEIMLQQTTVPTVKGYFDRFLSRWPTVADLAKAEQGQVLAEWAGLGYYARARNLYKCANVIIEEYNGHFPSSEIELRTLPGIGDYTSAAIAAIAFNERAAPVDGNIERVYSRLFRIKTPLPKLKKEVKAVMEQSLPTVEDSERFGDFAQALMDLGSGICKPKNPLCDQCPLADICEGCKAGDALMYPVKAPKKEKPTRYALAFLLRDKEGRVYFEVREEKGLLGGMLGVPHSPWDTNEIDFESDIKYAPIVAKWEKLDGLVKHTFTHFHLRLTVMKAASTDKKLNGKWLPLDGLKNEAIPTVMMKVVEHASD